MPGEKSKQQRGIGAFHPLGLLITLCLHWYQDVAQWDAVCDEWLERIIKFLIHLGGIRQCQTCKQAWKLSHNNELWCVVTVASNASHEMSIEKSEEKFYERWRALGVCEKSAEALSFNRVGSEASISFIFATSMRKRSNATSVVSAERLHQRE